MLDWAGDLVLQLATDRVDEPGLPHCHLVGSAEPHQLRAPFANSVDGPLEPSEAALWCDGGGQRAEAAEQGRVTAQRLLWYRWTR